MAVHATGFIYNTPAHRNALLLLPLIYNMDLQTLEDVELCRLGWRVLQGSQDSIHLLQELGRVNRDGALVRRRSKDALVGRLRPQVGVVRGREAHAEILVWV